MTTYTLNRKDRNHLSRMIGEELSHCGETLSEQFGSYGPEEARRAAGVIRRFALLRDQIGWKRRYNGKRYKDWIWEVEAGTLRAVLEHLRDEEKRSLAWLLPHLMAVLEDGDDARISMTAESVASLTRDLVWIHGLLYALGGEHPKEAK